MQPLTEILPTNLATAQVFSVADYRQALDAITTRARQDRCGYKKQSGQTGWADCPLTATRINEHLTGHLGCGVGFIAPGQSTTRLALFDLDSHKGLTPFADMTAIADRLCARLDSIGLRAVVFRSSGGEGLHIWLLWNAPQDAYSVRQALQRVLTAEGLVEGTAGIAGGHVEIFPKQNALTTDQNGSMAILPLWGQSEMLIDDLGIGLEPAGRDVIVGFDWPMSDAVPYLVNTAPDRVHSDAAAPDSPDRVARALAAIPNDSGGGTNGATDYDEWRNLLFATHHASAGQEWGFDRFNIWTNQNPGNAGRRETRRVWDQCKPGLVTRGTLYAIASRCNPAWDAPTPHGFDDIQVEDAAIYRDETATSDVGNAGQLAGIMRRRFIYVHNGQGWCEFRDGLYVPCSCGEQKEIAKLLGPLILSKANSPDLAEMKKVIARANRAMSASGLVAALSLAESDPRIAVDPTDMDADPDLLNTENCVVHLPTGATRPHDPSTYMARQCAAPYEPNAACPRFDRFMLQISANDPEWVDYMQRLVGYTISGRVNEEIIIFMLGFGANGKSVFSNIMRRILNSYAGSVPANFLMISNRDGEAATPSLARLPGVRMAQANEVEAGSRLSAQVVKVAASSDAIAARHLHKSSFEFTPSHTLWVRGNHRPIITDTDDGIWRRIRLLPFDAQFGPDDKDVNLEEKLMAEAPGILAWMVRGHLEYLRRGLTPARRVSDASAAYRKDSDVVAQWISERTKRGAGAGWAQPEAYQDYREWCVEQGVTRGMTKRSFTLSLTERGVREGREGSGARRATYAGLEPSRF